MPALYPLRFEPIYRDYLWGGELLMSELGKAQGSRPPIAESWEVVDHDEDQSRVTHGELAGKTLQDLMCEHGAEIVGEAVWNQLSDDSVPSHLRGRFPLLFKFLDAQKPLSVQVHPDDERGRKLDPPDLGKTEAWYIMRAEPGSKLYAGLKVGVTAGDLQSAIEQGNAESLLHSFEPKIGDCVFIPAGTIHALGEGLMIGEIQQASNTTYRLYDWNRVGADGKPRALHIEAGLEAIDFSQGPVSPQKPTVGKSGETSLVKCDKFELDRWTDQQLPCQLGKGTCRIVAVINGEVNLLGDAAAKPLRRGDTALIPASLDLEINKAGEGASEILIASLPG